MSVHARLLLATLIAFSTAAGAGDTPTSATDREIELDTDVPFRYEKFEERDSVARWLLVYDRVAWITTDMILAEPPEVIDRLGGEWFCYVRDDRWYAVYGEYEPETDSYDVVRHFATGEDGVAVTDDEVPDDVAVPFARTLHGMRQRVAPVLQPYGVTFNTYVRRLDDGRIETWMLPTWQTDGRFVFGSEYRFVWDEQGRELLEGAAPPPKLREFRLTPETRLILPNDDAEAPSVGQIFTVLLAREHVDLVGVRSRDYVSLLVTIPDTGKSVWAHVYNEHDMDAAIAMVRDIETHGAPGDDASPPAERP